MPVDLVFQYRTLLGKCDLGVGLGCDEIERLMDLEAAFAPALEERRMKVGRKFRRETTQQPALMRGDRINDCVELIELAPGGFVVRKAPFVARGEQVEVQLDDGDLSYRFIARGVWLQDDGDDYRVGLALIGMPVALHKVAVSVHATDVVDEITAAA